MREAAIRVEVVSPADGDELIYFRISATNGHFSATQKFWNYSDSFKAFGQELLDFPTASENSALFEVGTIDGNSAYYFRLPAYLFDAVGHAAIEFAVNNRQKGKHFAQATFQIHCEVAAINRLGQQFLEWSATEETPLIWKTADNRF